MIVRNSFLLLTFLLQALTLPYLAIARRARHRLSPASTPAAPSACGEFSFPRAIEGYEQVIDAVLSELEGGRR